MNDHFVPNPEISTITSSLKIDEAIQRSRKVMEESKALTYKNSQKKSIIEGKLRSVLSLQTEGSDGHFRVSDTPKLYLESAETPKSNLRLGENKDDLQQELRNLNSKISAQSTQIRLLEMNVSELKQENTQLVEENRQVKLRHKQEIEYLTEMYEEKLKGSHTGTKDFLRMEERLRELEENFTRQIRYNCDLEEKISKIVRTNRVEAQSNKILEIEKEYLNNQESISEFENKLDSAKRLLKTSTPKFPSEKVKKIKRDGSKSLKEKQNSSKPKPKKKPSRDS